MGYPFTGSSLSGVGSWLAFQDIYLKDVILALSWRARKIALKQSRYKAGYLFEGCYFGAIMGSAKKSKN